MCDIKPKGFLQKVFQSQISVLTINLLASHNKNIKLILKSTKKKSCVRKFEKKKRKEEHKKNPAHYDKSADHWVRK